MTTLLLPKPIIQSAGLYAGNGYIAGRANGIVTVDGQPASREILLFTQTANFALVLIDRIYANADGTYLFKDLSTRHRYLVMARDNFGKYEPVGHDWVTPAVDVP